ncbi:UAA transporter [Dioszegia hungarica]|uniref:UAA transporter n=1 Tax=Dioszegia hungarica TaxID=4972 RepID=A0AA38HG32_9TREE|nr:UAA transporter [Dioszegia hungarica]KAI9638989.1 UAA transporter [Dioszegia hungarica]
MTDLTASVAQASVPEALEIFSLIFGGCCSNVWALEAILKTHPGSGTFLTFSQFIFVTLQNLSKFTEWPQDKTESGKGKGKSWLPRLKKREVPIRRWLGQVALYLGISLLNNYAFGLKIPMTVHIIFRSGGLCVSMLTSYFVAGKRYSRAQILAGLMITVGIVLATLSAPSRRSAAVTTSATAPTSERSWAPTEYAAGIAVLMLALLLSSLLGLFQEETYRRYGKAWQEGLFYSHLLSIPFFLPFYPTLISTFKSYAVSPPTALFTLPTKSPAEVAMYYRTSPTYKIQPSSPMPGYKVQIPSALLALAINVTTQGLCIRGVNRLTARVSSTTVNLVLTVRKAVSLGISVWYYGSGLTPGLAAGGTMVLRKSRFRLGARLRAQRSCLSRNGPLFLCLGPIANFQSP